MSCLTCGSDDRNARHEQQIADSRPANGAAARLPPLSGESAPGIGCEYDHGHENRPSKYESKRSHGACSGTIAEVAARPQRRHEESKHKVRYRSVAETK